MDTVIGVDPVLTNRQREVLYHIAFGLTANEIAATLGIAYDTVKDHTKAIHEKLGVNHNYQAVGIAFERGLIV
jgi:DNA-binding CsgD family transcriptional regulator